MARGRPRIIAVTKVSDHVTIETSRIEASFYEDGGHVEIATIVLSRKGLDFTPGRSRKKYRVTWDELRDYCKGR